MPEDPNEVVAMMFHGLVTDLQQNDVKRFEDEQKKDREERAALRRQNSNGLSAGELLKALDGDPEALVAKVQEELAKQNKEAQAAVAEKDKAHEQLPAGHFPPPPTVG